jgi:hypothetical protein
MIPVEMTGTQPQLTEEAIRKIVREELDKQ